MIVAISFATSRASEIAAYKAKIRGAVWPDANDKHVIELFHLADLREQGYRRKPSPPPVERFILYTGNSLTYCPTPYRSLIAWSS